MVIKAKISGFESRPGHIFTELEKVYVIDPYSHDLFINQQDCVKIIKMYFILSCSLMKVENRTKLSLKW